MSPEGLGLRIRQRRQQLGLTMKALATRTGVNVGTLSSIELYYVHRVPGCLPAIAEALEMPLPALVAGLPLTPRSGGGAVRRRPTASVRDEGWAMPRILIVDDDPNIVQLLADVLADEGYDVATATQSLRVFDRAKEVRPHLILMDLVMPYIDGLDQIKLLSLEDDLNTVPFIVISAKARALEGIEDPRALRIVDCLYKPFSIADLLDKVAAALAAGPLPPPAAHTSPARRLANTSTGAATNPA